MHVDQLAKIAQAPGFVAALDQSGGSTPGALASYGVTDAEYSTDAEMFDQVHAMRTRIITSPAFTGRRIVGAILFEMTMDREIHGQSTPDYLWNECEVVPFLKVDKGMADEVDGGKVMKPNPGLGELLDRANAKGIFGTKMRSVVEQANPAGVNAVVADQFDIGLQILQAGLMPIIEPEVNIHCPDKAAAEDLLADAITANLDRLGDGQQVMLKLTLPEVANRYADLIADPRVLRVVALSGGYSRDEANRRLSENNNMIASFSRALAEGLSYQQSEAEFDATLEASVAAIFAASNT